MTSFIKSHLCVKSSFFTRINELDELLEDGLLDHPALVEALSHLVEVDDGTDILTKFLDLEGEMEHSVTGDFFRVNFFKLHLSTVNPSPNQNQINIPRDLIIVFKIVQAGVRSRIFWFTPAFHPRSDKFEPPHLLSKIQSLLLQI